MKTIFTFSILCLILINAVYGQELIDYDKEDVHYIKADIDKDEVEEEISAISGELELGQYICMIKIRDGNEDITKAVQIDMLTSYCLFLIEISPNLEPFIGLGYGAGAHGYELVLFRYIEQGINQHVLKEEMKFWSDRPSIQVKDVNGDGIKEIVGEGRDYEIDPVNESYICIYKYTDAGKWERISVYRTATNEYMSKDWDKDKTDIEAYMATVSQLEQRF